MHKKCFSRVNIPNLSPATCFMESKNNLENSRGIKKLSWLVLSINWHDLRLKTSAAPCATLHCQVSCEAFVVQLVWHWDSCEPSQGKGAWERILTNDHIGWQTSPSCTWGRWQYFCRWLVASFMVHSSIFLELKKVAFYMLWCYFHSK
jgi:hypothetical protein